MNAMTIETERLILRPFTIDDAEDVYEYLKEPMVNCFADMKLNSLEEARTGVQKRSGETEYYFAIVLREVNKVIGKFALIRNRQIPIARGRCWIHSVLAGC